MALNSTNSSKSGGNSGGEERDDILIREIDDAVREEQLLSFLQNYGKIVLGVVISGLVLFAAYLIWDHFHEKSLEADSEALTAALDQVEAGNLNTASKQLDTLIAETDGLAAANAKMLKAGIAMEKGRSQEAAKIFAEVAADDSAPKALRDLALVREIGATFDDRKPDDIIAKLRPIAVKGEPFFGSAGEMLAMAYLAKGDNAKAGALFAEIAKDESVPESLRSRARQIAGLMGVDAIADVNEIMKDMAKSNSAAGAAPGAQQ